MKDALNTIAILAMIAAVIGVAVWWQVYRYGDCRHVGHSRLYCVMSIGK